MGPKNLSSCLQAGPLDPNDILLKYLQQATAAPALANAALLIAKGCSETYVKVLNVLYKDNDIEPPNLDRFLSNQWREPSDKEDSVDSGTHTECQTPVPDITECPVVSKKRKLTPYHTLITSEPQIAITKTKVEKGQVSKFAEFVLPRSNLCPLGPFSQAADDISEYSIHYGTDNNLPITSTPMVFDVPNIFTFDEFSTTKCDNIPASISAIGINPQEIEKAPFKLSPIILNPQKSHKRPVNNVPVGISKKKSLSNCIEENHKKYLPKQIPTTVGMIQTQEYPNRRGTNPIVYSEAPLPEDVDVTLLIEI